MPLRFGAVGFGAHQQDAPVGLVAPARPHLLAGHHVVVAVADRPGLQRGEVGAGVRLGEPLAPHRPADDSGQETGLLLVGPGVEDRGPALYRATWYSALRGASARASSSASTTCCGNVKPPRPTPSASAERSTPRRAAGRPTTGGSGELRRSAPGCSPASPAGRSRAPARTSCRNASSAASSSIIVVHPPGGSVVPSPTRPGAADHAVTAGRGCRIRVRWRPSAPARAGSGAVCGRGPGWVVLSRPSRSVAIGGPVTVFRTLATVGALWGNVDSIIRYAILALGNGATMSRYRSGDRADLSRFGGAQLRQGSVGDVRCVPVQQDLHVDPTPGRHRGFLQGRSVGRPIPSFLVAVLITVAIGFLFYVLVVRRLRDAAPSGEGDRHARTDDHVAGDRRAPLGKRVEAGDRRVADQLGQGAGHRGRCRPVDPVGSGDGADGGPVGSSAARRSGWRPQRSPRTRLPRRRGWSPDRIAGANWMFGSRWPPVRGSCCARRRVRWADTVDVVGGPGVGLRGIGGFELFPLCWWGRCSSP